jgi:hypothetical protein
LLLCHCAPIDSTQPQGLGFRASPAVDRVFVSSPLAWGQWFEIPFNWQQLEIPDNEPEPFMEVEPTIDRPEWTDALEIAPLVVTTTLPDFVAEDWPSDIIDAERKAAWISPKVLDSPHHHATQDSVDEWMRSLR